jgi:hypothetical protein
VKSSWYRHLEGRVDFNSRTANFRSGQSRRFEASPATSGLPQSTDIATTARLVRFVPAALKAQAAPIVIPRQGISGVKLPRIRLRADWIAVILALSAKLPAMNDRHHRSSPEIGR